MLSLRNKLLIFMSVLLLLTVGLLTVAYYQYKQNLLLPINFEIWQWQWHWSASLFLLIKLGMAMTVLFSLSWWLLLYLTQPLKIKIQQLQTMIDKIEKEDYQQNIQFSHQDEFSQLGEGLKRLMQTLADKQAHYQAMSQLVSPLLVQASIANQVRTNHSKNTVVTVSINDLEQYYQQFSAKELLHLLNNYFTRVNFCINNQQGITLHYMGNTLVALFGQQTADNPRYDAVQTAIKIQQAVTLFNLEEGERYKMTFDVGVGISYGKVMTGKIGAYNHHQYSVLGDAVDLSQQLQQLCSIYGVTVLLDQSLESTLAHQIRGYHKHTVHYRELDVVKLGKNSASIHLLTLLANDSPLSIDYLNDYTKARDLMKQQQFVEAKALFSRLYHEQPADIPCRLLLARCQRYVLQPLDYEREYLQGAFVLYPLGEIQ